jgi:hypothetical protein
MNDWHETFGLKQEAKPDYFDRPLVKVLFPLGGFLVGAIGLLTSSNNLPSWALIILVSFVAICALVLLWPPLAWTMTRVRTRLRRNRAARLFYPDVQQTIRRLHEHLGESVSHTLIYELRDFTSIRDKKENQVIHSLSEATNIKEWLAFVSSKAQRQQARDFVEVSVATNLAAAQYRRLCESLYNRLQYVVSQNLVDEANLRKLKNGWNSARDSYASMMQDWAKTCDKINHQLGDFVAPSHYSPLRTLE